MRPTPWFNGMVLSALLVALVTLGLLLRAEHRARRASDLRADSVEVASDSSRRYLIGEWGLAARRAYQREVELNAALAVNRAQGATLVGLRVERDSLRRVSAGRAVEDTAHAQVTAAGELAAESLGVTVRAVVSLQPVRAVGPLVSAFDWTVVRHPLPLDVAIVCLPGHRAEARITGPPAVPLTVTEATSRADICYPPPRWDLLSLRPPGLPWLIGAFLLGRL